jgi:hypothetical protein
LRDGALEARGEAGAPRICSAKLPRWFERGSGLEDILRAGGGGDRPNDDVESLRDWSGGGTWPPFLFVSALSAMVEGTTQQGAGCRAGSRGV